MTHQAALTAAGFEQLLVGVHDPFGRSASLSALGLTPEERFSDLVNGILPLLLEGEVLEHDLRRVMELLGRARGQAVAALEAITEVYFDSDRESDTRMVAAQTMVLIGGVLWAVEQFGVKDLASCSPFQATAIVEAIAHGGSVTEGTFDIEPSLRAIPRVLLITAVRHESPAVREAAVWALLVAHSEDEAVIKNAQGEYQVNPDLRRVLHTLMREDPDPDLRVMAAQTVHELFPMWIDRRRQRDEEQGRQNDAGNE